MALEELGRLADGCVDCVDGSAVWEYAGGVG